MNPQHPFGTTVPGSDPGTPSYEAKVLGFAILWSKAETHRVGEVGLLVPLTKMLMGRGVPGLHAYLRFGQHRPGAAPVIADLAYALLDSRISKKQLETEANDTSLTISVTGDRPTFVNDTQIPKGGTATLTPGDQLLLWDCALFLVVERQRVMPALAHGTKMHPFGCIDSMTTVGEHPDVWGVRNDVWFAGARDMHVLIRGENGSGKEALARAIHDRSTRARKMFNSTNAALVSKGIFASELFGIIANYPNGNSPAKEGILTVVEDGTVFLDEVGGLTFDDQTMLCRALQSAEYQRVGEARPRTLHARIIAATSAPASVFKDDFFFRFGWRIRVPPVRERASDIPFLIRHLVMLQVAARPQEMARFLERGADGKLYPRLAVELVSTLVRHPLPGNVRELGTILERAIAESRGDQVELPQELHAWAKRPRMSQPPPSTEVPTSKAPSVRAPSGKRPSVPAPSEKRPKATREEVVAALEKAGGSVMAAKDILGVPRTTLRHWIEEYGLGAKASAG